MSTNSNQFLKNRRIISNIMFLMALFMCVIIAFLITGGRSFGWFSASSQTSATGMQAKVGYNGFELKVADGTVPFKNLFDLLNQNEALITSSAEAGDTIRWRVEGEDGSLMPGSQGVLSFHIISTGADISQLHYNLSFQCYTAETSIDENENEIESLTEITDLSDHSSGIKSGANYLKTHIMFFTNRTGTDESNYQYSGFIDDVEDFTLEPNCVGENEYSATIYWLWPNTVGQLLLNSSVPSDVPYMGNGVYSVLNGEGETTDRETMINYLKTHDLYAGDANYSSLITDLYADRDNSVTFQSEYDILSSGYNAADLMIGKSVNYVSLLLTANP